MKQACQALAAGLILSITAGAAFAGAKAQAKDAAPSADGSSRPIPAANAGWRLPALPDFEVELWDGEHYLRLTEIDRSRLLVAEGPNGSVLHDGPIDSEAARASLEPAVRRKMDQVMALPGVMIFIDTAASSAVEASFDEHWPQSGPDELAVCSHERLIYEGLTEGPGGRPLHAVHRIIDHRLIYEQPVRRIEVTVPWQELCLLPAETF